MKLFRELNPYFNFYIFIKILFPIIISWDFLALDKDNINLYTYFLLFIGIIVFLLRERSTFTRFSMTLSKNFATLIGISLLSSFSLILFFDKWNIFNKNSFSGNNFLNYSIFILVIPVIQGFFYRKILLTHLSKIYGKNFGILIMALFLILFGNQFVTEWNFLVVGLPFILGYLYLEERNITKTILVHIFYNALIIAFIKYFHFIKIPKMTLSILIIFLSLSLILEFKKYIVREGKC